MLAWSTTGGCGTKGGGASKAIGRAARVWWLPVYVVGGVVPRLADGALGRWVQHFGGRPGRTTALIVNAGLPVLAVALAASRRRIDAAWVGAIVMTVAYTLGLAVAHPQGHRWQPSALLHSVPPVLVVVCLGYGILGSLGLLAAQTAAGRRGAKV